MATISLSPVQQKLRTTPKQRVPLGVVSNGANSPFGGVATKRSREQVDSYEGFSWENPPQAKRQALDNERQAKRSSPRKQLVNAAEARVFSKRSSNAPLTTFERQLLAARDEKAQQKVERQDKSSQQSLKGIKLWQEHYKRAFPMFVFYFEGIPEDVRIRCSKYARSLGAREEKFFSKDVTHVVTTRDVPAETDHVDVSMATQSSFSTNPQTPFKPRTINPSLLDQSSDRNQTSSKSKFVFEANKRGMPIAIEKKTGSGSVDVLLKAKEMGMKVWQLEKFQRMIRTMLENPSDGQTQSGQINRNKATANAGKGSREAELSRMLRNERLNGPSDRDSAVAVNEYILFKGPYIYIRDMDERTKPILVRDYQKPAKGEQGDWPQFHGVSAGRCPFIPEAVRDESVDRKGREPERELEQEPEPRKAMALRSVPSTRANVRQEASRERFTHRSATKESNDALNGAVLPKQSPQKGPAGGFCPPPARMAHAARALQEDPVDPASRLVGGEPAASGMQPSNITSAIRSQMISSTAAAPGARAGTSKEVHGLQRKVLQKHVPPSLTSHSSRGASLDPAAVARAERAIPGPRQTRRQAQQTLVHQDEDSTQSEDEDIWMAEGVRRPKAPEKSKCIKGKAVRTVGGGGGGGGAGGKPGYCENCRDKYDDFDEHVISRKHRKFALTNENWKDLDRLLAHLGRRVKEPESDRL